MKEYYESQLKRLGCNFEFPPTIVIKLDGNSTKHLTLTKEVLEVLTEWLNDNLGDE